MNTTYAQGRRSTAYLRQRLSQRLPEEVTAEFVLSYNYKEDQLTQALEVFAQRETEEWSNFFRWVRDWSAAPDWFQSVMDELSEVSSTASWVNDEDVRRHVGVYFDAVMEGKKVLVVSHSQGNLYANAAYAQMSARGRAKSFGIVGAATPASVVGGGGPYTSLENDLVMNAVRAVYPSTLPANARNANVGTRSGHTFREDYLDGNVTGPQIMQHALAQIDALEDPNEEARDGAVTVTLEWGAQPDVDLHVFEPGGTHVYYAARAGSSGYLDLDDTNGYGPEHYYASCDRLQEGTYTVGVNYYRGSGPETANVRVRAGTVLRARSVPLAADRGAAGNGSPTPAFAIQVVKDENGDFEFSVEESHRAISAPTAARLSTTSNQKASTAEPLRP